MGDFNQYIDWANKTGKGIVENSVDIVRDYFFNQHIIKPVVLDLVMCVEEGLLIDLVVKDFLRSNDHMMVEFQIQSEDEHFKSKTSTYDLNKRKYNGTEMELSTVDWINNQKDSQ